MKIENVKIWEKGEYNYKMSFGFEPNIMFYLHDDDIKRPFMLVAPGGGYCSVWHVEGEVVSNKFYEKGYNVGVFTYTTNVALIEPVKKQALNDISRAVRYIRKNADMLNVMTDKICICGFSAGGHLCASLSVHHDDTDEVNQEYVKYSAKPNASILSYPVITMDKTVAHIGSTQALIARDVYENQEKYRDEIEYFSLEKKVNENTSPCFVWHTATDDAVPVENSYLFAQALQKAKIPYALHIFSYGHHGLSTADAIWSNREFGEPYTFSQTIACVNAIENGELKLPNDIENDILEGFKWMKMFIDNNVPFEKEPVYEEVAVWIDVAEQWLNKVL